MSILEVSPERDLAIAIACNRMGAPRVELVDALSAIWGADGGEG